MAGKRKAPSIESSSDEEEDAGRGGGVAGSDSNWEDQDTSGDEGSGSKKLRIAIPKRKKVRKKKSPRSPRRGSAEPVNIPEDFLSECSKLFLDKRLDDKAARINWGRKQVRLKVYLLKADRDKNQRQDVKSKFCLFDNYVIGSGEDGVARSCAV